MAPAVATMGLRAPYSVFSLSALGMDPALFLGEFTPHFHALPWDRYDVKRAQVMRLIAAFPQEEARLGRFLAAYFADKASLADVADLIARLPEHEIRLLDALQPYRQRAIAHLLLERESNGSWNGHREAVASFSQTPMAAGDYRALPRVFAPMAMEVTESPRFHTWLQGMAEQVRQARPEANRLKVTCHQMRTIARPGVSATNSPEGIHQDGADYIVSAMVVEREGVTGGESRVYDSDKETVLLRHTLQPGEGLFQADAGSPLWHDVSPVAASGPSDGVRSLFGLDIRVV
ncbi:MAG: 2OG-Fe dioxygenase family protein [Armatimonas sp.]